MGNTKQLGIILENKVSPNLKLAKYIIIKFKKLTMYFFKLIEMIYDIEIYFEKSNFDNLK